MKKVITYGTFDLFHEGHQRLLSRAKNLGDYLIVGVTTENYDKMRGKLNVHDDLMKRIENVKNVGLADEIIIEEYEGQKINDIQKHKIDIFVIGSDWVGKFDYLKNYCEVIYLERTKGISSTSLRAENSGIMKMGMIGYGRIARRFIKESKYVSGVNIEGVFGRHEDSLEKFSEENELAFHTTDFEQFLDKVDSVYIASPHLSHYDYIKRSIMDGKHVLCEKPLVLSTEQANELYDLADKHKRVLLEAIKTAFAPGFIRLIGLAKSGVIGHVKSVEATFTKLVSGDCRELRSEDAGGSMTELASYPLLAIIKLLGEDFRGVQYYSHMKDNVDLFTQFSICYDHAIATGKVGLGVKSEGDLKISGTKGYIYAPAPWWKTEYFEVRFEDQTQNQKFFYKFENDGLRYELAEFVSMVQTNRLSTYKLSRSESISIISVIDNFLRREEVTLIK